jgi:hypothetical protein
MPTPQPWSIFITVSITTHPPSRRHSWSYASEPPIVEPDGSFVVPAGAGTVTINYQLDAASAESYQLIMVNLDATVCATREIESIVMNPDGSITVTDANTSGYTNQTPFSLRLLARDIACPNVIGSGFSSPDPQVTNDPGIKCPDSAAHSLAVRKSAA